EGLTYTWSWDELVSICGEAAATALGATPRGNWEGSNVLWRPVPLETVASEFALSVAELGHAIETARPKLFERRSAGPQPGLDDKVLAAWNGLAVAAFAEAGAAFEEPRYVDAAEDTARFILSELRRD